MILLPSDVVLAESKGISGAGLTAGGAIDDTPPIGAVGFVAGFSVTGAIKPCDGSGTVGACAARTKNPFANGLPSIKVGIASAMGFTRRAISKHWPERATKAANRYLAHAAEKSRTRSEERLAAADDAARQLVEAGISATPKAMKAILADKFCFAGSRLWTPWRERQMADPPNHPSAVD